MGRIVRTEKFPNGIWRGEDGRMYVARCPKCGSENYALAVASGVCVWCGYNANEDYKKKEEEENENSERWQNTLD